MNRDIYNGMSYFRHLLFNPSRFISAIFPASHQENEVQLIFSRIIRLLKEHFSLSTYLIVCVYIYSLFMFWNIFHLGLESNVQRQGMFKYVKSAFLFD